MAVSFTHDKPSRNFYNDQSYLFMKQSLARKRYISYGFLLINVVCWGGLLAITKLGLDTISPFRFLLYRFSFAVLFSAPILWFYWPHVKKKSLFLKKVIGIELIGTSLALALLYIGLRQTTSLEANFIGTTSPIFLTLAGIIFLKEREERHEWVGAIMGFVGTLALVASPLLSLGAMGHGSSFIGNGLILLHNIVATFYFIKAKTAYHYFPKLLVTTISFYVGMVTFAILSWAELGFSISRLGQTIISDFSHPLVWIVVLYAAFFGSIVGLTAYIKGQDGIEASEASLFAYLQPLVYIPLGYILLKERVGWFEIGAVILILFGVVIAEYRRKK